MLRYRPVQVRQKYRYRTPPWLFSGFQGKCVTGHCGVVAVQLLSYYQYITPKHAFLCLHPVKLLLNFGRSAAPNPYNYVAALVHYATQGSVRDFNRWG